MDLQTEGGILPAGVLHPSVFMLVGTLHLQTEQPAAGPSVHHDAVGTGSQPGPPGVDEQAAVLNGDLPAQRRGLQLLQGDIMSSVKVKEQTNSEFYFSAALGDEGRPPPPSDFCLQFDFFLKLMLLSFYSP